VEELLVGLDIVPRRVLNYRGRSFPEFDLDAILNRKPELVLVDELAHTNVPGSRHRKRWQDIEELLNAGIDVDTTLNIQHLESLNDVIERITGIKVHETLPDKILESADEIKLIDLSPDDLIKRLREGKVYVPDQAVRAVNRFFSRGNLTALRELALRIAAERVDKDMADHIRARALGGAWRVGDRILVCVEDGVDNERLVRTGKRMADRVRASWTVLHVSHDTDAADTKESDVNRALILAEQLGAETETLNITGSASEAVLTFARSRLATRILCGHPENGRYFWQPPPLYRALLDSGSEFEITVIGKDPKSKPAQIRPQTGRLRDGWAYGWAAMFVAAAVPVAVVADRFLPLANISLIFLTAVLATAMRGHIGAAVMSSLVSFLVYNFMFTEPRYTFHVLLESDVLTILFFFIFSLTVGVLAAKLRAQMDSVNRAAGQTRAMNDFSRRALAATSEHDMAIAVVQHVSNAMNTRTAILRRRPDDEFEIAASAPEVASLDPVSLAAAEWSWSNRRRAGWHTDTLPEAKWLVVPLVAKDEMLGLLAMRREDNGSGFSEPERKLLDALIDQSALILERGRMIAETAEAQRYTETERLRSALLSSVSHDLRTPLVSILGAATTLTELGESLKPDLRRELLGTVAREARRLDSFIQNLLDMTRIGYGAVAVKQEWIDLGDVIRSAREQFRERLEGQGARSVSVRIAKDAGIVRTDEALLQQTFVNLIDNAIKYSPPGSPIEIEAERQGRTLRVRVADRGPGIPEEKAERLFDLFFRAGNGDSQAAGTGLGLMIVRGFVEAMGGTITAANRRDGPGAVFEIRLPQAEMPRMAEVHATP
jgi:two-component system sensor histidine kinase KdpD